MAFNYRKDLKVELKATQFFGSTHQLMYRISPDQDLTYYKEYSFLGIKFKIKRKFSTKWYKAYKYLNHPSAYLYSEKPVNPVLFHNIKEFLEWKNECKTIGDFFNKLDAIDKKELAAWKRDREKYLENCGDWK